MSGSPQLTSSRNHAARRNSPASAAAASPVPHGRLPSSLRFPRSARLLKHSDFERVYKQGRRHFSPHLTAFYLLRQSGDLSGPRVGFTVGRVLGGAVERNRIKRRLREAVRLNLAALSAPVDVVINPKKSVLDLEFAQLRDEIRRAVDVVQQKSRREPD